MDTQSGSEETMLGDPDRIARDYAKMRIELDVAKLKRSSPHEVTFE